MIKRLLCICLISIFALTSAYAEGLPTITDGTGEAVAFTASESAATAPESGDWNRYANAVSALDAAEVDTFRTLAAIKATDLDYNSYLTMAYTDKASVITALLNTEVAEEGFDFYAEGDDALANAVAPAYVVPSGDFAVFALTGNAWANVGMFSLTGEAAADSAAYLFDLSCYDYGDVPAYLARYDETDAAWHVVGLNQAFVDAAVALVFY